MTSRRSILLRPMAKTLHSFDRLRLHHMAGGKRRWARSTCNRWPPGAAMLNRNRRLALPARQRFNRVLAHAAVL